MWKFGSAAAVLVALTSASAALAGGGSADRAPHQALKLTGNTVQVNLVDAGEPGFTLGDQVAFTDDLRAAGKPAGVDGGVCTLVRIADAKTQTGTVQCEVTYSLDGGQITTQALGTLTNGGFVGTQDAAITGGTGRFRAARGESHLEFVRPGELKIMLAVR
jgi:hypothetical protein